MAELLATVGPIVAKESTLDAVVETEGSEMDPNPEGATEPTGSNVASPAGRQQPRRPDQRSVDELLVVSTLVQDRALASVEEVAAHKGGASLLTSTGPVAEMTKAQARGLLDEAKRLLIARKGAGVVFEARMVSRLQHSGERFGIVGLRARLSTGQTDPVDIFLTYRPGEGPEIVLPLQLKTGGDKYIRACVKDVDGRIVVVPRDVDAAVRGPAVSSIGIDGADIPTPTRADLIRDAQTSLDRLTTGESSVSLDRLAREAVRRAVLDGMIAGVVDIAAQVLSRPKEPIDWLRTARMAAKVAASSSLGSFLAGTHAYSAVSVAGHSLNAAPVYRTARVAGCVVPHAIDVAFDFVAMRSGKISADDFGRSFAKHGGAAVAEMIAFKYLARLAARAGPVGGVIVMIGGGLLVSKFGSAVGELILDLLGSISGSMRSQPAEVPAKSSTFVEEAVATLLRIEEGEFKRRIGRSRRGVCEEPRCGREHHARGMCSTHYGRWWRRMRRTGWRPNRRSALVRRRRRLTPSTRSRSSRARI